MSSIAVINAGSSSIKSAVFEAGSPPTLMFKGQVEGIGAKPRAKITRADGALLAEESFENSGFGGLDALVVTGGIGENDAATRAEVAQGCAWLGMRLDDAANSKGMTRISAPDSQVTALVIPSTRSLRSPPAPMRSPVRLKGFVGKRSTDS